MDNQNVTQTITYPDQELEFFKQIILNKLSDAKLDLASLLEDASSITSEVRSSEGGSYSSPEDGSATMEKETMFQMAARQKQFISQLEAALLRIQNKTYGVCRMTGKLIPRERLIAVPHTTLSMEAKQKQRAA